MKNMIIFGSIESIKDFEEFESYCLSNNVCKGLLRHMDNRNLDDVEAFNELIEILGKPTISSIDINTKLEEDYFTACLLQTERIVMTTIEIKEWTWVDINKNWTYDNITVRLGKNNWLTIPELCDLVIPCSYIKVWATGAKVLIGKSTDSEQIFNLLKPNL